MLHLIISLSRIAIGVARRSIGQRGYIKALRRGDNTIRYRNSAQVEGCDRVPKSDNSIPDLIVSHPKQDTFTTIHVLWKPIAKPGQAWSLRPLTNSEHALFHSLPASSTIANSTGQNGNEYEETENTSEFEDEAPSQALLPKICPHGGTYIRTRRHKDGY
ncbi:hypothetical protein CC86DRAFT_388679 [Ophiobolus disseminans]|uniref:Uncharacterized protein n=1 Tax=Ophiobolus disseminans TaxID=1469910 RepID=A0A6A6ZCP6_9PLEO|nr:hypothetical protein CC86DRAFT_388679 [Ophiobolus disseminans]